MKRTSKKSAWKHNFSCGANIESHIDPKMSQFSEVIAQKLKCDFVGIDIIQDNNDNYIVIEINLAANFKGFKKVYNNIVATSIFSTLIKNKLY